MSKADGEVYHEEENDVNERHEAMRQMRREIDPSYTLEEIGERFGVTRERVRQVTQGVSPGREVEKALAQALPVYAPIEVEIVNPWGVRELCQECLQTSRWNSPQGPVCSSCETKVRYRADPEFRARQRQYNLRNNSGPCPRPTPRCLDWYKDVWQHVRGFGDHSEEYEEIYAELREMKGLPPKAAPPRRGW